ncbi:MAG TPA: hypothetical protein VNO55_23200, partial [Polyangia bacterium]|nr:hypothetical protein [Polyangia bacterium]
MVKASTASVRSLSFLFCVAGGVLVLAAQGCGDSTTRPNDAGADRPETVDALVEKTTDLPQEMAPPQAINLIISDTTVKVNEGDMKGATFTVSLSRGSSTPVSLMVASGDATVATVDHDVVTFDANDTGPKTITVFGTDDLDTVQNSTKLTLSAAGVTTASVLVEVTDDDVQAIKVMPGQVMMTEGNNEQASVVLAFDPLGTVTVTLASTNAAKLSTNVTTLTFNSKNYFIPQQITLTAAEDDDTSDDTVTINVSATGIPTVTISAKIIDNDVLNFDSQG